MFNQAKLKILPIELHQRQVLTNNIISYKIFLLTYSLYGVLVKLEHFKYLAFWA